VDNSRLFANEEVSRSRKEVQDRIEEVRAGGCAGRDWWRQQGGREWSGVSLIGFLVASLVLAGSEGAVVLSSRCLSQVEMYKRKYLEEKKQREALQKEVERLRVSERW
jgi:hypothetical protein